MKNHKLYEADDRLISIIRDNYNVLQSLGSFGISLGFGDKKVREVCEDQHVDTYTFLAVVNFTINGFHDSNDYDRLDIPTLVRYLQASHSYYLDFQLPFIRKELVDTFSKHHGQTDVKLRELKNIIIKYLPSDGLRNNQLSATLYDIYNNEEWLAIHAEVEEQIFIPAIRHLEERIRKDDVSAKISDMIHQAPDNNEVLGEREKDVIISLVQGMTNKEIADHLCISVNTVITHRRNIARKLQIRSAAGLTIYAIVNNLVDISNVKL